MKALFKKILIGVALLLITANLFAQRIRPDDKYTRQEVMIPMRDGIKLHTVIFIPKIKTEKLPFLMARTPYGINKYQSPERSAYTKDMADDGYIFVYQDIKGRYLSEGKYEMSRFSRDKKDPKAIDESSDTNDSIDWLLKNIPDNNGKVGLYGISYDGWTAIIAASDPHPAIKAVSEQATPSDMFMNDDLHHNGAFRLSYAFEYAFMEEISKTDSLYQFSEKDTYDWYLKLGPLSNINDKYIHGILPSWNAYVEHPNYDDYWKKQAVTSRLDYPRVAVQNVSGWWDQEDMVGPQDVYKFLEKHDTNNKNYIVLGPWRHGGWSSGEGSSLGNIKFDEPTAAYFRKEIQAKWFAWFLKDKGDGKIAEAISFQTGSNKWKNYSAWPPKEAIEKNIYFHANGKLSFDKPTAAETKAFDSYVSDPANPVPYRTRPVEETYSRGSRWSTWLTEDQRFVNNRPDVLTWQTDSLKEDITITGDVIAKLFASTSGSDADWVVKLIDVYPEGSDTKMSGYELMIADDVFRGRFRKSFTNPEPITPGKVEEYSFSLHGADHVFKKGHKIMVQVQSTWFPIIDRNPQKYVPNIFKAKESDYQSATQNIYHSVQFASSVVLPVMQ